MLENMKVGERGQVTIPKKLRERYGLGPGAEVEFRPTASGLVLRRAPKKLALDKWKGRWADRLRKLGYTSTDDFIEDIRGR